MGLVDRILELLGSCMSPGEIEDIAKAMKSDLRQRITDAEIEHLHLVRRLALTTGLQGKLKQDFMIKCGVDVLDAIRGTIRS